MQLKPSALAGWALFLLLLFLSIFYAIASLGTLRAPGIVSYLLLGGVEILVFGIPTIILKRYRPLYGLVRLRGKPFPRIYTMYVLSSSLALTFLSFVLNCLCVLPFGRTPTGLQSYYPIQANVSPQVVWTAAVALSVIPAIVEELFLRGAIFSLYEKRGTMTALILTSCAFSMLHASPDVLLPTLVAGMGYGYMLYCTDSVWAPILAHLCNNLYALFITVMAAKYPYNHTWEYFIAANVVLMFLCGYVAFRTLRNLARENAAPRFEPGPGTFRSNLGGAMGTAGFALFAGLFLIRLLMTLLPSFS